MLLFLFLAFWGCAFCFHLFCLVVPDGGRRPTFVASRGPVRLWQLPDDISITRGAQPHCVVTIAGRATLEQATRREMTSAFLLLRRCGITSGSYTYVSANPENNDDFVILHVVARARDDYPQYAVYRELERCKDVLRTALSKAGAHHGAAGGPSRPVNISDAKPWHGVRDKVGEAAAERANRDDRSKYFYFWPRKIPRGCVVASSKHFVVLVDRNPQVKGHLLIVPRRVIRTSQELTVAEVKDLANLLHRTLAALQRCPEIVGYSVIGCTISIQQGKYSGQSMTHFHLHVYPFQRGGVLDVKSDQGNNRQWTNSKKSNEEMVTEATLLKKFFKTAP